MSFTRADAENLFSQVRSRAKNLGIFPGGVISHDPESTPAGRLSCSIALGPVKPVTSSGLAAVSVQITLMIHIWSFAMQRPLDDIEPEVLGAVALMMGSLAGGFTLGGTVREIDLFEMHAEPGYVDFEGKEFRTMTITVPMTLNDCWTEAP